MWHPAQHRPKGSLKPNELVQIRVNKKKSLVLRKNQTHFYNRHRTLVHLDVSRGFIVSYHLILERSRVPLYWDGIVYRLINSTSSVHQRSKKKWKVGGGKNLAVFRS